MRDRPSDLGLRAVRRTSRIGRCRRRLATPHCSCRRRSAALREARRDAGVLDPVRDLLHLRRSAPTGWSRPIDSAVPRLRPAAGAAPRACSPSWACSISSAPSSRAGCPTASTIAGCCSWYYGLRGLSLLYLPFTDFSFYGLSLFAVFYGLDWVATVPPTVRLTAERFGPRARQSGVRLDICRPSARRRVRCVRRRPGAHRTVRAICRRSSSPARPVAASALIVRWRFRAGRSGARLARPIGSLPFRRGARRSRSYSTQTAPFAFLGCPTARGFSSS